MSIKSACFGFLLAINPIYIQAQPWEFNEPIAVTSIQGEKIFHHLESSGRRNIAISGDTVAVAWEDDRDGTPRIYLARKGLDAPAFSSDLKISGSGEAYEPSLVALGNGRFALAWEEDARIHLTLITPTESGTVIELETNEATQPSLASHNQELLLAFSQRDGRYTRIFMQHIKVEGLALHPGPGCAVDAEPAQADQLYPAITSLMNNIIVAWEDRRPGHTIIMASQSEDAKTCKFYQPQRISEELIDRNAIYGKGHGVARVALARHGTEKVLAAWADKRDFRTGYDIYSAHYQAGGKKLFGPNIRVQDDFGGLAEQWHTSVASDPSGRFVVAWDDRRDDNADIMLSWLEDDGWSDDFAIPGASGTGEQAHPSISLDSQGNLHLAWVERSTVYGPTQLRYLFGRNIER
jgi:hypothetical protein